MIANPETNLSAMLDRGGEKGRVGAGGWGWGPSRDDFRAPEWYNLSMNLARMRDLLLLHYGLLLKNVLETLGCDSSVGVNCK